MHHYGRDRVCKPPSYWSTRNRSICTHDLACDDGGALPVLNTMFLPKLRVAHYFLCGMGKAVWRARNRSICTHDLACDDGGALPVLNTMLLPKLRVVHYLLCCMSGAAWSTRNRSICTHDLACDYGGALPVLNTMFLPKLRVARYLLCGTGGSVSTDRFLVLQYEGGRYRPTRAYETKPPNTTNETIAPKNHKNSKYQGSSWTLAET